MTRYLRDDSPLQSREHPFVGPSFVALVVVAMTALALNISSDAGAAVLAVIGALSLVGLIYGSVR